MRIARPRPHGGFTLIEMMIAVSIVSILAAIAIPQFRLMQLRAKRTEVFGNLEGIAKAQLVYYQLHEVLLNANPNPPTAVNRNLQPWVPTVAGWSLLQRAPDGRVRCQYRAQRTVVAGNFDWVRVTGTCDMDGNNQQAQWILDVDPRRVGAGAQHLVLRPNAVTAAQNRF